MATAAVLFVLAVACASAWAMAAVVLRAGPARRPNRRLALLLVADGLAPTFLLASLALPAPARVLAGAGLLTLVALPFLHLLLLYPQLDTPLVAPLRRRPARVFLWTACASVLVVLAPSGAAYVLEDAQMAPSGWSVVAASLALLAGTLAFGLVAAVSACRRATRASAQRAKAGAFLLAFGLRDGTMLAFALLVLVGDVLGVPLPHAVVDGSPILPLVGLVGYVVALAYGILREQLFDIELRVRRGIALAVVGAAIGLAYLVGSVAAHRFVAPRWGAAAGVIAAGSLLLFLVPLQRAAERVAARLTPEADEPGRIAARRRDVFRTAARHLAEEEMPDAARARILSRLGHELDLDARERAMILAEALDEPPAAEPTTGDLLAGRFLVVRLLGRGSQGTTYLCRDIALGREVALKIMPRSRFLTAAEEARRLAAIRHPNVGTIHDLVETRGQGLLVLELAERGSLQERLRGGPLDLPAFLLLARGLLSGLDAIHVAGLLHKDVKPSNVLFAADGRALVADLGVATELGAHDRMPVGAIAYMAPEVARGAAPTARSDLFSAAATLYEARVGRRLRAAKAAMSPAELRRDIALGKLPDVSALDVELRAWAEQALAPEPEDRFATAGEMLDALEAACAARVSLPGTADGNDRFR